MLKDYHNYLSSLDINWLGNLDYLSVPLLRV